MSDTKAPSRVEIPSFPNGKRIALTTSFDDGVVQDRRVVKSFNEWGIKGTFNLNSGKLLRNGKPSTEASGHIDASEVAELYKGHEVAVHTVSHPHLTKLDSIQIALEVINDRKALEDLVGYPVRGMAYPFGSYDEKVINVLRECGIVYSRTCENSPCCFPPKEPLAWASTSHMYRKNTVSVNENFENCHGNPKYTGVIYIWGHTYEFDRTGGNWADLERIFKPMSGKPDIWYCTNIELFDYEAARRLVVIAANLRTAYNPSAMTVSVSVDGKLTDLPPGKTVEL
ncbi:MAG TPA: polysaccharide deacetylase [Lentisphaeria bacterium]|nr:MAG: polysaccharide deacetylase [Lentisphaerae bacterium GWF2_49_21]HBC88766.1 polysaccharide deacetylase [Lentisphaeria bacterium]